MSRRFAPELVNGPFGDPGAYVDFAFEGTAILFDLGDLSDLAPRKLLRVTDAFVSHMHLDHFFGFDRLLRGRIGRDCRLRLFGPEGFTDAVRAKLAAYSWNLIKSYKSDTVLVVHELVSEDRLKVTELHSRRRFRPEAVAVRQTEAGLLLAEPDLAVRCTVLDHGIPCLAFALEEREHVNILKGRLDDMGLGVGPWLNDLKRALRNGAPADTPIRARWRVDGAPAEKTLPLGELAEDITRTSRGEKIAYVVDASPTLENAHRIVTLCQDADVAFIEARFLEEDADLAAARNHLTAHRAGILARDAGAHRLVPFHFSPRYEHDEERVRNEALEAFGPGSAKEPVAWAHS